MRITKRIAPVIALLAFYACTPAEKKIEEEIIEDVEGSPSNAKDKYPLTKDVFSSWFANDSITKDGAVNAANSLDFANTNNADFYKWSYQMFLWITSMGNDDTRVFDSQTFYDVAPEAGSKHMRQLIKHEPGVFRNFAPRLLQTGNANNVLDRVEQGQAGGADVLMSKNGSLVYYTLMVNDVMAAFRTKTLGSTPLEFPSTENEINDLVTYAYDSLGISITDQNALAMELKLSWVETSTLSNPEDYIQIQAIIPVYTKLNDSVWKSSGQDTTTSLSLLGMHVVGNTKGHPEMLWATFEHAKNTPQETYTYLTKEDQIDTVKIDTNGDFVFCENGASGDFNVPHMGMELTPEYYTTDTILAKRGKTISASNSSLVNAWGAAASVIPNPLVSSVAESNSEVISLNDAVISMLVDGDVRKNYLLIGCTWTNNGGYPYSAMSNVDSGMVNYPRTGQSKVDGLGAAVGTSRLANSTMETYHQDMNCFNCHNNFTKTNTVAANTIFGFTNLSHIFSNLDGLKKVKQ